MEIDLQIDEVINKINKKGYRIVVIQLPDGLKPYATNICREIEAKTNATVFIWMGSNFGGCDIPIWLEKYNIDALFHFGHTRFIKKE